MTVPDPIKNIQLLYPRNMGLAHSAGFKSFKITGIKKVKHATSVFDEGVTMRSIVYGGIIIKHLCRILLV